jgi:DNA-binding NtrC family response regulator
LLTRDNGGNKIIVAGIPSLEENAPILLIYFPEISDILRSQLEQLKDPSSWDYTLYLETTQSGRVINELIPGSGEKLLAFKINLLSTALSKKATLLELPEADLEATVEILHSISLRQVLHTMKLTAPEKNDEAAIKLFGLNPLMQKDASPALLEKLDNVGTLFIQNIEYLGLASQEYLAEFISFGFFNKYKSDHKVFSNVRIICSTSKDLLELVNQGKFSKILYNELQQTSVAMPPLHELSPGEIEALMRGFADQMTASSQTYKNLLTISDKDSAKILQDRPLSLKELRDKVHQIIVTKSTRNNIAEVSEFDPAYNVSDPDIAHAVRLGKKALKDPQIMSILWNKFRNQNKIATLLGVNRSSVNRRCQEYGLTD